MSRPALLHNMSAPPRTVIVHKAVALVGRTLLFRLPPGVPSTGAKGLLTRLIRSRWTGGEEAAIAELRERVNECAGRLALPPAVLVTDAADAAEPVEDLLAIYAVLSKSSDRVYLRDKEPNLARIEPGRRVVLRLPGAPEKGTDAC
jgi:hypothetical protein